MDFIKINFCASKDIIKKLKKLTEWKKICANYIFDKIIYYLRYTTNSYSSTIERQTTQLKIGKGLEKTFFQRYANNQQALKKCSTSSIIREI